MRAILKLLAPIRQRLVRLLSRAIVTLVDDTTLMQSCQLNVLAGETLDSVERFQNYGFTGVSVPGAEAILLALGGNRGHPIVVAIDDRRYRKKDMQAGEVAVYTKFGDYILLKQDGTIEVVASTKVKVTSPNVEVIASAMVKLDTPLVQCEHALTVKGLITGQAGLAVTGDGTFSSGNVVADGIGLKTHVHNGVQTGGGNTGLPH